MHALSLFHSYHGYIKTYFVIQLYIIESGPLSVTVKAEVHLIRVDDFGGGVSNHEACKSEIFVM